MITKSKNEKCPGVVRRAGANIKTIEVNYTMSEFNKHPMKPEKGLNPWELRDQMYRASKSKLVAWAYFNREMQRTRERLNKLYMGEADSDEN